VSRDQLPALPLRPIRLGETEEIFGARDPFDQILIRRVFAYLIDACILALLFAVAGLVLFLIGLLTFGLLMPLAALTLALLPLAYHSGFHGYYGATPGMALLDLELRDLTGGRPGYLQAALRTLLFYGAAALTGWLILIVALLNRERRALHDFITNTRVERCGAGDAFDWPGD
jgi:uncharacterized RDD family membrane protein YckC